VGELLVIASGSIAALAVAFANYLSAVAAVPASRAGDLVVTIASSRAINVRGNARQRDGAELDDRREGRVLLLLSLLLIVAGNGGAGRRGDPSGA
jgi:hypothetical protein